MVLTIGVVRGRPSSRLRPNHSNDSAQIDNRLFQRFSSFSLFAVPSIRRRRMILVSVVVLRRAASLSCRCGPSLRRLTQATDEFSYFAVVSVPVLAAFCSIIGGGRADQRRLPLAHAPADLLPGRDDPSDRSRRALSFNIVDVHNQRFGPYTTWPRDAIQAGLSLPHLGAQVSFSGSLIENLNALGSGRHERRHVERLGGRRTNEARRKTRRWAIPGWIW